MNRRDTEICTVCGGTGYAPWFGRTNPFRRCDNCDGTGEVGRAVWGLVLGSTTKLSGDRENDNE